jgi:hypothetical protein
MQPECNELLQDYDAYVQEQRERIVQRYDLRMELGLVKALERYPAYPPAASVDPLRQPPAEIMQRRVNHLTPERRNELIQWYQQHKWSGPEEQAHFYNLLWQYKQEWLARAYDTLMQGYRAQLVMWCANLTQQVLEEPAGC